MKKILSTKEAVKLSKNIHREHQILVLTGGCFDILHIGHVKFLTNAKKEGDILMVMLEHDATIKKRKGHHRPLNNQSDRAEVLASLAIVDYIITLPTNTTDEFYNELVNQLKPAIIATTAGDPYAEVKKRQANQIGATVVEVIKPITNKSTTKLLAILNEL